MDAVCKESLHGAFPHHVDLRRLAVGSPFPDKDTGVANSNQFFIAPIVTRHPPIKRQLLLQIIMKLSKSNENGEKIEILRHR
jgi:hypothetical protein